MKVTDLEQVIADIPLTEVPALIGQLASLQARAQLRLFSHGPTTPTPTPAEEHYLPVEEVGERFRVTARWLYRHKKQNAP